MSFRSSVPVRLRDQHPETGSIPGSSTIKGPGQGDNREPGPFCVNTYVNKPGYDQRAMASLRTRNRKDGTAYHAVLYRHDGRQTSTSFEDLATAMTFRDLVDVVGPAKALASVGADPALSTMTVEHWLAHYIDHLTGLAKSRLRLHRPPAGRLHHRRGSADSGAGSRPDRQFLPGGHGHARRTRTVHPNLAHAGRDSGGDSLRHRSTTHCIRRRPGAPVLAGAGADEPRL